MGTDQDIGTVQAAEAKDIRSAAGLLGDIHRDRGYIGEGGEG